MTTFQITYAEDHDNYDTATSDPVTMEVTTSDVAADVLNAVATDLIARGCTVIEMHTGGLRIVYLEQVAGQPVRREIVMGERDVVLYHFHMLHKSGCMIIRMADAWGTSEGAPWSDGQ